MPHLRDVVIDQFSRKYDEAYVKEKIDRLKGLSNLDVIFWATYALDSENQIELCNKLGISKSDFDAAARVMTKVSNL